MPLSYRHNRVHEKFSTGASNMAHMNITVSEQLDSLSLRATGFPVVAYFDLDRTLIDGYSLTALAFQQIFEGDMSLKRFVNLASVFLSYGLGRKCYNEILQATVDDITGMAESDLYALGRRAFDHRLADWTYREGLDLIEAHKQRGHYVVLVTSATKYQALPIAEVLGIDHMRCTEIEIVAGKVAGGVNPCYGEGKVSAAIDFAHSVGATLADAYFYTDSQDDLPLLEKVGHPIVVNGKSKLAKISQDRGWPRIEFQQKERLSRAA